MGRLIFKIGLAVIAIIAAGEEICKRTTEIVDTCVDAHNQKKSEEEEESE